MTLRVLLAVVVTVALLASAVPAVEEAQRLRAEHELIDSAERLEHAATTLARRNDPVPPGVPAATKRVRVTVPETPGGAVSRVGRLPTPSSTGVTDTGVSTTVQGKPSTRYPVDVPIRVSGLCEPASDGLAFALRAEGTDSWRLWTLVELGTLSPSAAGLLSIAISRGAAILVAGPRGAGKTTTAAALLWELGQGTRLLAIEDTPELPIEALQSAGRVVQRLEAASGFKAEVDPAIALHTALRFGDGALAVGEVRGVLTRPSDGDSRASTRRPSGHWPSPKAGWPRQSPGIFPVTSPTRSGTDWAFGCARPPGTFGTDRRSGSTNRWSKPQRARRPPDSR